MTLLNTAVAAVRSLATYVAVSLYVLILAPPALLFAAVTGANAILYILGHGGIRLGLWLSGITTEVSGLERVPADRAVIFVANHQSNIDPPVLFTRLHPRLHVVIKSELLKVPLLGRVFTLGGFAPVMRGNREQSMASIAEAARSVVAGNNFLVFPEGTRSRTQDLLPFKKGGFIMAVDAQAPIVPVAIEGGRTAMRKGSLLVWPAHVVVKVGEPIETRGRTMDERDELVALTRDRILGMLGRTTGRPVS